MIAVLQPLKDVENPRQLRRVLNRVVLDFYPINIVFNQMFLAIGTKLGQTPAQTLEDLVGELWSILKSQVKISVDQSDRMAILEYLKLQLELTRLFEQAPRVNQPAFYIAVADAFWALKKMDLCFMAIMAIGYKDLVPLEGKLAHWLCLAIKGYRKEWQSALLANDPVLQERLARPEDSLDLISTEEMERRLGL
jgi:hypothetical protein